MIRTLVRNSGSRTTTRRSNWYSSVVDVNQGKTSAVWGGNTASSIVTIKDSSRLNSVTLANFSSCCVADQVYDDSDVYEYEEYEEVVARDGSETAAATTAVSFDDYFAVLGLPPKFDLDLDDLKSRYRTLMTLHHPDKQRQEGGEEEWETSEDHASLITHAHDALRKPHTRAMHLLKLLGHGMDEEGIASPGIGNAEGNSKFSVGHDFLMRIMMIREEIEDVAEDDDKDCAASRLQELWEENQQHTEKTCRELTAEVEWLQQQASARQEEAARALELTAELQYWNRIEETLREKMHTLE